jgi:hypothetical protein
LWYPLNLKNLSNFRKELKVGDIVCLYKDWYYLSAFKIEKINGGIFSKKTCDLKFIEHVFGDIHKDEKLVPIHNIIPFLDWNI